MNTEKTEYLALCLKPPAKEMVVCGKVVSQQLLVTEQEALSMPFVTSENSQLQQLLWFTRSE